MPRLCTICTHADHEAIDRAMVAGETLRKLAITFGSSEAALFRHKTAHVSAMLSQAKQAEDRAHREELAGQDRRQEAATQEHAFDVVKQLRTINSVSLSILSEARQARNPDTALRAIDRIQRQIELQAKLLGELDERPVINLSVSAEWLMVRAALLVALHPYPDARAAVAEKLTTLEASNGHARV